MFLWRAGRMKNENPHILSLRLFCDTSVCPPTSNSFSLWHLSVSLRTWNRMLRSLLLPAASWAIPILVESRPITHLIFKLSVNYIISIHRFLRMVPAHSSYSVLRVLSYYYYFVWIALAVHSFHKIGPLYRCCFKCGTSEISKTWSLCISSEGGPYGFTRDAVVGGWTASSRLSQSSPLGFWCALLLCSGQGEAVESAEASCWVDVDLNLSCALCLQLHFLKWRF